MPIVNVWLRRGTTVEHRQAITDSIHRGMNTALGTPQDDYFQAMYELEPENFAYDPNYFGIERAEQFIMIQMFFNARPAVVKERLYEQIVDNLVTTAGMRRTDIMINIAEVAPENWWLEGRSIDPATGTDSRMSTA